MTRYEAKALAARYRVLSILTPGPMGAAYRARARVLSFLYR